MNSTHKAEVFKIKDIQKHPNADLLSIVTVFGGYKCVVRTQDFKPGDLAVFVTPDSVMPDKPEYAFLKGHFRIKCQKLRGVMSQGLILKAPEGSKDGDDVVELLGITHYVPSPYSSKRAESRARQGLISVKPPADYGKYDIDTFYRYAGVIPDGTPVSLEEKIDGCVKGNTIILMADGTKKTIQHIVNNSLIGEYVLGVGSNGDLTPSKILNVYNNGKSKKWIKIKANRNNHGRGKCYVALTCTENHRIWVEDQNNYIEARNLRPGQEITIHREEYIITPLQEQILIGKMLGDGCFRKTGESSGMLSFGHILEKYDYLSWTLKGLGSLASKWTGYAVSGYGSKMIRGRSICSNAIYNTLKDFIREDGKKDVPDSVVDKIGPIAIAFWYMDDGSLSHNEEQEDRAHFATCGFSEHGCKNLQLALKRYGINSVLYSSKKQKKRERISSTEIKCR